MLNMTIYILMVMMVALLLWPTRMMSITALAALLTLMISGASAPEILQHIAPNLATVLLVMSVTQLAVKRILQGGAGEHISVFLAKVAAHPWFRHVPAAILLPAVFVPASMLVASILHNITAIAVLVPLALAVCSRYGVYPGIMLSAMLISSNLGGASMAFGDTPAIIQRGIWGFTPAQFAAAMLPRNFAVLIALTATACFATWFPVRAKLTDWQEMLRRLKTRDELARDAQFRIVTRRHQALAGAGVLAAFIGLQFVFPHQTLVLACTALLVLLLLTPERHQTEALTVLGLEPIIVIGSLFIVAGGVEHTPWVQHFTDNLARQSGPGVIEVIAYLLTAGISADGSAAMLAPLVHQISGGSMFSAWQLASGICAGSSVFLTSASAGPILYAVSRLSGFDLTFRAYARFGLPFSLLMMAMYILLNRVFA